MDTHAISVLAARLERLERENRRWRWIGGGLALVVAMMVGMLAGVRPLVAQEAGKPVRMAYKVTNEIYLNQVEKPLQDLANDGWEIVQLVPTSWSGGDQGAYGSFSKGIAVARRPSGLAR
jgi:hypothetical protein